MGTRLRFFGLTLLDLFDVEGGFEDAKRRRDLTPRECKGLDVGGKATVLDAIKILDSIWSSDINMPERMEFSGAGRSRESCRCHGSLILTTASGKPP